METDILKYRVQDGYACLVLDRPGALNSFTPELHDAVSVALDRAETDEAVRALMITGAGRAFCAGQDLSQRSVAPDGPAVDLGESLGRHYNPLVRRLRAMPMPVVAAVNGVAAGAGANIALACDLVLAARSARFIQAFCKLGLIPDSGGTWLLPRLVGPARAAGLAMLGEALDAGDAERWGLIWRCVDDEALMDEAHGLCRHLAAQPTRGLAAIKTALRAAWQNDFDAQLDLERRLQRELGRSDDYQEGVTAFLEKRAPRFTGR